MANLDFPSEILGDRSGNSIGAVYLVDFGSVQTLASRGNGTITIVGTYGYMAPEQYSGQTTRSSDLYSLGATLIYLITGQHPADLPQTDLRLEFEQAANVSKGLSYWLKQMTEPIPSKRFSSTEQAIQALEELKQKPYRQIANATVGKVRKPSDTRVLLIKNEESLKISIPPAAGLFINKINVYLFGLLLYFTCTLIFMGLLTLSWFISFYINILWFLVFAPGFCFFLYRTILVSWHFLSSVFGKLVFCVDRQKAFLAYNLFGINFYILSPSMRNNIFRIEQVVGYGYQPCLIIWAGKREYKLCNSSFPLTIPEIEWIASELSNFLDLEIIKY